MQSDCCYYSEINANCCVYCAAWYCAAHQYTYTFMSLFCIDHFFYSTFFLLSYFALLYLALYRCWATQFTSNIFICFQLSLLSKYSITFTASHIRAPIVVIPSERARDGEHSKQSVGSANPQESIEVFLSLLKYITTAIEVTTKRCTKKQHTRKEDVKEVQSQLQKDLNVFNVEM